MADQLFQEKLATSIGQVTRWVEEHEYHAYDPGDGNNSFLHPLTFGNLFLERLLQQAVYRAPFNLRPWIGIRPHISTKGMGYMAWGYAKMFKLTQDQRYRERALHCVKWLTEHRAPGYPEFCWGNDFLFSTRAGRIPAHEPTIVWSSLIGQGLLECHEAFGESEHLEIATSVANWVMTLPREKTTTGSCLSYVPTKQSSIHNSNMLGAALLARVGQLTGANDKLELACEAMTYSCTRQNPDGAWFYGEAPKYHWIDNFHTGYNLDCLKRYTDATGDSTYTPQLQHGFRYFKQTFFEDSGRPKYYHDRTYPIDIQCAAQAIDTLSFFSATDLAKKVATWTIDNMQARDGHFYYRDLGWAKVRTPMLHWGQGTTFKALAHCLSCHAN